MFRAKFGVHPSGLNAVRFWGEDKRSNGNRSFFASQRFQKAGAFQLVGHTVPRIYIYTYR